MELKPFASMSDVINLTFAFVSADHRLWAINSLCYLETTSSFKPSKGSIFQQESACNIKFLFSSKQSIKHYCLSVYDTSLPLSLAVKVSRMQGFRFSVKTILITILIITDTWWKPPFCQKDAQLFLAISLGQLSKLLNKYHISVAR